MRDHCISQTADRVTEQELTAHTPEEPPGVGRVTTYRVNTWWCTFGTLLSVLGLPSVTRTWSGALELCTRWLKLLPALSMAAFLTPSPTTQSTSPRAVTQDKVFTPGTSHSSSQCSSQEAAMARPYWREWFTRKLSQERFLVVREVVGSRSTTPGVE